MLVIKKVILLFLIAFATTFEQIDYREVLHLLGDFNLEHKVICSHTFLDGDCRDLEPNATGCVWPPQSDHGWCAYMDENGKINNNFKLK
jgi:hypothetical protein